MIIEVKKCLDALAEQLVSCYEKQPDPIFALHIDHAVLIVLCFLNDPAIVSSINQVVDQYELNYEIQYRFDNTESHLFKGIVLCLDKIFLQVLF